MIPKVIHYCWFGRKPLPDDALRCIESWRRFMPDYEIKQWGEDNYDVYACAYTRAAYDAGKYAFVSDYARFDILYRFGGVYFDIDVELIRPLDSILAAGAFFGREVSYDLVCSRGFGLGVNPGLGCAVEAGHPVYKALIDGYEGRKFVVPEPGVAVETIVDITTALLVSRGLKNEHGIAQVEGINIYPADYFCPINFVTHRLEITDNTVSIHHYAATWVTPTLSARLKNLTRKFIPRSLLMLWNKRHQG